MASYQKRSERHTLPNSLAARMKWYTVVLESAKTLLPYINLVKQFAYALQSMDVTFSKKETSMPILNGRFPRLQNVIVALGTLGNESEFYTLGHLEGGYFGESSALK